MEQLINSLTSVQDLTWTFSVIDVVLWLVLSFILISFIWWIYKITHRGVSYAQSYVQTLVLMWMVVSIIMLIVWSNIARAFSLVWALSIIRFRNAVKETRDVWFIFFAMAIGMAMWTKFYLLWIIWTLVISLVIVIMNRFNRFERNDSSQVLRIQLDPSTSFDNLFDKIFIKYTSNSDLISIDSVRSWALTELVYTVNLKKNIKKQDFIQAIKSKNNNLKVSLVTGYTTTDL